MDIVEEEEVAMQPAVIQFGKEEKSWNCEKAVFEPLPEKINGVLPERKMAIHNPLVVKSEKYSYGLTKYTALVTHHWHFYRNVWGVCYAGTEYISSED